MENLNGIYETHYGNGQIRTRKNYKDNKLNGLSEEWYDNGQLKERSIWKDGYKCKENLEK